MKTNNCEISTKKGIMIALRFIGIVIGGITIAGVMAFLFGYFVMLLWNWLMPDIFGLMTINYWQAIGIIILSKFLFGAISHHKNPNKAHIKKDEGIEYFKKWTHEGIPPWKHHKQHENKDFQKWNHYEDFWKNEGKDAFENYVKNVEGNKQETDD